MTGGCVWANDDVAKWTDVTTWATAGLHTIQ